MNIRGYNFVACITEKQFVSKIDNANVYLVKRVELIPFYEDAYIAQTMIDSHLKEYVEGIKKLLVSGFFYFSYNTDLTSNRQRLARIRNQSLGGQQSVLDTCDKRYFWNFNICQDFFYQKVDPRWIVPIIQGFIDYKSCIFDAKELEVMVISRRRHAMAGTRYLSRGLDDEGHVANFVETETILTYKD